jgi:hypothetical protein
MFVIAIRIREMETHPERAKMPSIRFTRLLTATFAALMINVNFNWLADLLALPVLSTGCVLSF